MHFFILPNYRDFLNGDCRSFTSNKMTVLRALYVGGATNTNLRTISHSLITDDKDIKF